MKLETGPRPLIQETKMRKTKSFDGVDPLVVKVTSTMEKIVGSHAIRRGGLLECGTDLCACRRTVLKMVLKTSHKPRVRVRTCTYNVFCIEHFFMAVLS